MMKLGATALAAAMLVSACGDVTKFGRRTAGIEPPVSDHFALSSEIEALDRDLDALERAIELQFYSARIEIPDPGGLHSDQQGRTQAPVPVYPTNSTSLTPDRATALRQAQAGIQAAPRDRGFNREWLSRLASGRKRQVDMLCGRFFYSLSDASDGAGFTRNSINILTNTITTLMGLFEAPARDIAVVSGLQLGVNDWQSELEQLLLFTPSPQALRTLVEEEQRRYLSNNSQSWTEPTDLEQVREFVEGYAHQCTPMGIRATLEQTIQDRGGRNSTDPERNTVLAVQRDALSTALRRVADNMDPPLAGAASFELNEASLAHLLWWARAYSAGAQAEAEEALREVRAGAAELEPILSDPGSLSAVAEQVRATIGTVEPLLAQATRLSRAYQERRDQEFRSELVEDAEDHIDDRAIQLSITNPTCRQELSRTLQAFAPPPLFMGVIEQGDWIRSRESDLRNAVAECLAQPSNSGPTDLTSRNPD